MSDTLRACACMFWFDLYLRAPDFSLADGLFPKDLAQRFEFIHLQKQCEMRWSRYAETLGFSSYAFHQACIHVRAAWFGHDDILLRVRGLAHAVGGYA